MKCGGTESRHVGRGLCQVCYRLDNEQRHKTHISRKRKYRRDESPILPSNLQREYVEDEMSLSDLARRYNCTRQYIHKLLKRYKIERRNKGAARTLALNQGKLSFTRIDETGNESKVVLQKININKNFFKSWSPAMAYVLGVIYTDGNLVPSSRRDSKYKSGSSRFSITQKEPELLEKVLALMDCDAKLYRSTQRLTGNPIHEFHINDEDMYDDLLQLGLTPKKSLSLDFPDMPGRCLRHFIRGCWDGDGSIHLQDGRVACASFVSGSRQFAEEMIRHLVLLGLPPVTLHTNRTSESFYFRFGTVAACTQLYHVFYDDVPASMYLSRKFDRFRAIAVDSEGLFADEPRLPLSQRIDPTQAIPVKSKGQSAQETTPQFTHGVTTPKTIVSPVARILSFPEPFTRSMLARLLAISPNQVERIMQSKKIVANIYKLSALKDNSSKEFKDGVRELKKQSHGFLYGGYDEGWCDLD